MKITKRQEGKDVQLLNLLDGHAFDYDGVEFIKTNRCAENSILCVALATGRGETFSKGLLVRQINVELIVHPYAYSGAVPACS